MNKSSVPKTNDNVHEDTLNMFKRLAFLFLFVLGCGSGSAGDGHQHGDAHSADTDNTQISEGCKHLQYGPDVVLDLTTSSAAADAVHTRYQVTLRPSADDPALFEGVFQYTAPDLRHYFIADEAVTVTVSDESNTTIAPVRVLTAPVASCEQANTVNVMDLAAQTYTLRIHESSSAELQLVIHVFGAMHDHDH